MLNVDSALKFFVRIKEFPEFPEIEGKVIYIREVSADGIKVSFTDDCRPSPEVYTLSEYANDNGWYDVSSLILKANTTILPKYGNCVWVNEVAMNYRNFIEGELQALDENQSVGKICLLGTVQGRSVIFTKQAYYVVGVDNNGYILAYSGFCQPLESWKKPDLKQRVLYLIGTSRRLFLAEPIVKSCNEAYEEDLQKANDYVAYINATAAASSTNSGLNHTNFSPDLHKMHLHD